MKTAKFTFTGTSPLLLCSDALVDPLHPLNAEKKKVTGKKSKDKTADDIRLLYDIDFRAGLYHDEAVGPYLPAANIDACMRQGAAMTRQGRDIARAFMCFDDRVPIQYDGPRDLKALIATPDYRDIRSVVQQRQRIMKCRPIFRAWKLVFDAVYDPNMLDETKLAHIAESAGKYVGVGTYRPRFGRFAVAVEF
jgi:hypothetical protein